MIQVDYSYNDQFPLCDKDLLDSMSDTISSDEEKEFIEKMVYKEVYEYASSADAILLEDENDYEIFIIRWYDSEYEIGRGNVNNRKKIHFHPLSLSAMLEIDMFELLGFHITVIDWLRSIHFKGINYNRWEEE